MVNYNLKNNYNNLNSKNQQCGWDYNRRLLHYSIDFLKGWIFFFNTTNQLSLYSIVLYSFPSSSIIFFFFLTKAKETHTYTLLENYRFQYLLSGQPFLCIFHQFCSLLKQSFLQERDPLQINSHQIWWLRKKI